VLEPSLVWLLLSSVWLLVPVPVPVPVSLSVVVAIETSANIPRVASSSLCVAEMSWRSLITIRGDKLCVEGQLLRTRTRTRVAMGDVTLTWTLNESILIGRRERSARMGESEWRVGEGDRVLWDLCRQRMSDSPPSVVAFASASALRSLSGGASDGQRGSGGQVRGRGSRWIEWFDAIRLEKMSSHSLYGMRIHRGQSD
jgi:hypothetical protein